MKRILHVVGRMDRGGTESMLMTYYRNIDRNKIQFDFVVHTTEKSDFEDEILALGGKILRVPRFNVINFYQYKHSWNNLLENHPEYDVLHVHHFLVAGIVLPIAQKHGLKIRIAHSHNTKPPIFILKEKIMWLFHHNLIKYSTKRLGCSKAAGEYLFGQHPFEVFHNAIDTDRFRYNEDKRTRLRKEFGYKDETFVIGHVGSFRTRQKNHRFIIDIFAEVYKKNKNARLLLIGVGELQQEIREKTESLGLSNVVTFAGLRNDVPDLLSAMDVFLFPSFFEGLSVVSVEVQAAGLPCIASNTITKESCLTNLFKQLDLSDSIDSWANEVLNARPSKPRELYCEDVSLAGYSVTGNIKKLEEIYELN